MILQLTPGLLRAMKRILDENERVENSRFPRVLKLTFEESKQLVAEAMRARGWADFMLLLNDGVADTIRRDVIKLRFESKPFRDRSPAESKEHFDLDEFWAALRERCRAIDNEADIAILAVLHDHLVALLGARGEIRVFVPNITEAD